MFLLVRYMGMRFRKWISYKVGLFMAYRWPFPIQVILLKVFVWMYKIQMQEAELSLNEYRSLQELFIRRLKKEIRPKGKGSVYHPCDSVIFQCGRILPRNHPLFQDLSGESDTIKGSPSPEESSIENSFEDAAERSLGFLIQAKGIYYSVKDFLGWEIPFEIQNSPQNGRDTSYYNEGYYITYYLCPTDYHRVHSPVSGHILSIRHFNGDLFPVHAKSVQSIDQLYIRNERLIVEIMTTDGLVCVVFVGALNVGSIHYNQNLKEEKNFLQRMGPWEMRTYSPHTQQIKKGEELGYFSFGSTVVVLWPKEWKLENDRLSDEEHKERFQRSKSTGVVVKVNTDIDPRIFL